MQNTKHNSGGSLLATALIISIGAACLTQPAWADNSVAVNPSNTNVVNVAGSAILQDTIPASTTVLYNLSTTLNSQPNTNLWPAIPLIVDHNIFAPSRIITIQEQFALTGAGSSGMVDVFAASTDGTHWQTNPCPLVISMTANGTAYVQASTNYDTAGWQYFCLFATTNLSATIVTNRFLGAGFNRNL